MTVSDLPENIDEMYDDDENNPSRKEHQLHHDILHGVAKRHEGRLGRIPDPSEAPDGRWLTTAGGAYALTDAPEGGGGGGGLEPGMWGELFPDGEASLARGLINNSSAGFPGGRFYLSYWKPQKTYPEIGNIEVASGNGSSTAEQLWLGLYQIDEATGDGTLIASTPDDPTIFANANTVYQRAFTAPVELVAGQWYAWAALNVGGTFYSLNHTAISTAVSALTVRSLNRRSAMMFAQTELPATFAGSDLYASPSTGMHKILYGRVF